MTNPVRVGIVGCGTISRIYLENAKKLPILDVVACADLIVERAEARAEEFGVARALTVDDLLDDPSIELVINLTIPRAHADVARQAIAAGKSIYNEKPLAVHGADGRQLVEEAQVQKVRIGCAPDTFLGGGLQTCRKLIDDGVIGQPVAATAFFLSHGHESWHPDPDFYYQPGGGPLFDMGPYYLTALVALLGPIRRVTGSARVTFPTRTITSQPKAGATITVNTPTHVAGVLDFAGGAVATIITSFDVWPTELPWIEIYGTEGSLRVPDPNTFGGPVRVRQGRTREWLDVPLTHGSTSNSRGLGPADLATGLRSGRPHRASGALALHVLDTMESILAASDRGTHVELTSTCDRPAPLPPGLPDFALDA
jgi:predicted dehydrogenase